METTHTVRTYLIKKIHESGVEQSIRHHNFENLRLKDYIQNLVANIYTYMHTHFRVIDRTLWV